MKLGQRVNSYSKSRLAKVKRMGLTKFKKSFLKQQYFYLVGLAKYTIRKKGGAAES